MWEADLICCVYSCCCVRELSTHISISCTWVHSLYSGISLHCTHKCSIWNSLKLSCKISFWRVTQRLILHVIWCLLPPVRVSRIRCCYVRVKVLLQTAVVAGGLLCLRHSLCQFMNFGPFLRQTRRGEANSCVPSHLRVSSHVSLLAQKQEMLKQILC